MNKIREWWLNIPAYKRSAIETGVICAIFGSILVGALLLLVWRMEANNARAISCVENGYTPIYSGYYGTFKGVCERTINGNSESILVEDLE